MKTKKTILITIGFAVLFVTIAAAFLPLLARTTNCGGNSYALSGCKVIGAVASMLAEESSNSFNVLKFPYTNSSYMIKLAQREDFGGDFLIKTNFVSDSPKREIILVCKKQFDNVPQPTVWNLFRRNPAHAVCYSDISTALISPQQFAELDLTDFIPLSSLATNLATNAVQP